MKSQVVIIDSGGANIASLCYALERLDCEAVLTTEHAAIERADRVILPGVGAAADAMQRLRDKDLDQLLPTLTQPVLGICLGMQLLAERSEENASECLGVFPLAATRLPDNAGAAVPNMGWCQVKRHREHPLMDGIEDGSWFYFVHSYALPVSGACLASAEHAIRFAAIVSKDNFHAAQCHPERSAAAGSRLLANFLQLPI